MKIAIASSGLGHVARGVETWACDTAIALSQLCVKDSQLSENTTKNLTDVTLFSGAILPQPVNCHVTVLSCLKRSDRLVKLLKLISLGFTWRWGLKSAYGWEQFTFWLLLWPKLLRGRYDILHVQDPMVAYWCRLFRKWGLVRTKEILAHGTEEQVEFLEKFDYLQELTPHYATRHTKYRLGQIIGVAPNFVDTHVFVPAGERKDECRRKLGIPPNAFVVLSVGSINRGRKRMDYLVTEFACWGQKDALLMIAGACDSAESKVLVTQAKEKLGVRLIVLADQSRERMPDIYAVADVFVLCALRELFGISFLEAMACGIPCIGHRYTVTEWLLGTENPKQLSIKSYELSGNKTNNQEPITNNAMAPSGGMVIDMSQEGTLAEALAGVTPEWLVSCGSQARERAEKMFSKEVVIGEYVEYYRRVMSGE